MEPFQYKGSHFKAYDETYDLTLDIDIDSNTEWQQINHFPIIAYAYTDVGYKQIYQGLNVTPCFKLDKNFEIKVKLKISWFYFTRKYTVSQILSEIIIFK